MWYICGLYVHNPERTQKILRTQFKIGNGRLGKLTIDTLDSSMMKKTPTDSKVNGKKPGPTRGLLG